MTVEPDVLYVDEGDVLTSAGVAAGIDLCLHLVATTAARRWPTASRGGSSSRRTGRAARPSSSSGRSRRAGGLAATRAWMLERLGEPLTVEGMAAHAGYSPRTFARRFRAETGTTPLAWLLDQRVAAARRLLEETDAPVELVAARAGSAPRPACASTSGRATRTTPTAYRAAFRAARVLQGARPRNGLREAARDLDEVRVAKPEPPLAA